MATIPGIIIFGGFEVQGGNAGNAPAAQVTAAEPVITSDWYIRELMRVTPDNADGSSAAASLGCYPWFDENAGDVYTVDSSASSTVTVTPDPGWTTNEWAGFLVTNSEPTPGYGFENFRETVVSNTSDTLTISGSWGTNPTAGTGAWMNEGRFTDYAPLGAYRTLTEVLASAISFRGGGSVANLGIGLGPDVGLIPKLFEQVFDTSPYFVTVKLPTASDVSDFAAAGAPRTAQEAQMAKANAAFALRYPSDTVEWRYIISDLSLTEITSWIAALPSTTQLLAYQANLIAMNTWLRGAAMANNATARILQISHDPVLRNVDGPASTAFANSVHAAVQNADTSGNNRTVALASLKLSTRGPSTILVSEDQDQELYDSHEYIERIPQLLTDRIKLWEAGAATSIQSGMPCYIMLGDSIEVGEISTGYSTALDSTVYTATTRDSRQRIYNRGSVTIEVYDAHDNSQTSGSTNLSGQASMDFSLTVELMNRHPDTGFVLIKRASAGSALATEASAYDANEGGGRWLKGVAAEHYAEITTDIENAFQAIGSLYGRQADLLGIFVGLGTNDASIAGGGAALVAALPGFCADLRTDFSTRTTGERCPIIWRKPQLGVQSVLADEILAIREGLEAYELTDSQFVLVDTDDYERTSDNIHETADANLDRGIRSNAALSTVALT